jgi:hypothetical protein
VFHVSLSDPPSISRAFENFVSDLVSEDANVSRLNSKDTDFFVDNTQKEAVCLCK